jgi:proline racemase
MKSIELISVNCCGEVGDVIVNGVEPPHGRSVFEQAEFIKQDKKLWNYVLNEPRGGVFKHVNLIVPSKNPVADMGFIVMEPADVPPMSGSNSICVATVILEKGIIPITNSTMNLTLEAPGGLINVEAKCNGQKVESVKITNLPSFVVDFENIMGPIAVTRGLDNGDKLSSSDRCFAGSFFFIPIPILPILPVLPILHI